MKIIFFLAYGSALIEHVLSKHDLLDVKLPEPVVEKAKPAKGKGKNKETFKRYFDFSSDVQLLLNAINEANDIIQEAASNKHKVYICVALKTQLIVLGGRVEREQR